MVCSLGTSKIRHDSSVILVRWKSLHLARAEWPMATNLRLHITLGQRKSHCVVPTRTRMPPCNSIFRRLRVRTHLPRQHILPSHIPSTRTRCQCRVLESLSFARTTYLRTSTRNTFTAIAPLCHRWQRQPRQVVGLQCTNAGI